MIIGEALRHFQSFKTRLSKILSDSQSFSQTLIISDFQNILPLSPFTNALLEEGLILTKLPIKEYAKEYKSCLSCVPVSHSGWIVSLSIEKVHVIKIVGVRKACRS